jgi:DNA helicase-2/ATP-dependent DNA helicase PcrA
MSHVAPGPAHGQASQSAPLDPDQRAVAQAPPGPLLVLAGAGSGKTLALAARVVAHLEAGHVRPREVLAITFTTKAARELADRLARLAGPTAAQIESGTHHAVCARMLRRHAALVDRTPRYSIYEPTDVLAVLRRVLDASPTKTLSAEDAQRRIAEAKGRLQRPDDLSEIEPRLAAVWRALEDELRQSDALDFDDLLATSVHLMREQPAVAQQARERWRMLLVDEFQDTNGPQWAWLELVCAHRNLTVLGDDDQAIFGWRGGQVERLLELDTRLPGTRVMKLERNYRSSGQIVQAANRLIVHNAGRREKRMWTTREPGTPVVVRSFVDEQAEAQAVAAWCRGRLSQGRQPTG